LAKLLAARFAEKPAPEWERLLTDADVGCVEANMDGHANFVSYEARLREDGFTREFDHPRFGPMVQWTPYLVFSETPSRFGGPCFRGQHNRSVLLELGYSSVDIDRLHASGALVAPDPAP
jgi:crotonobetainyl-CoA:carnitine CoA-transferase CaiB-like acyl-CoA transferase